MSPDRFCCPIGGGGPITVNNVVVSMSDTDSNADNIATISFSTSPAGGTSWITWALTPVAAWNGSGYEGGGTSIGTSTEVALPYLSPGTTFYFQILVTPTALQASQAYTQGNYTGSFAVPAIPSGVTSILGYVLGPGGSPMADATVTVSYREADGYGYPSCGPVSTTTASSGAYAVESSYSGEFGGWFTYDCIADAWSASQTNYWTENWTAPSSWIAGQSNWQTFRLLNDQATSMMQTNSQGGQNGVYSALAYVHTANAACTVEAGYSVTNSVFAYAAGSGFTDTKGFTSSSSFPGTGSPPDNGESLGIVNQYYYTGAYSIDPAGGINHWSAWAVGSPVVQDYVIVTGTDPIATPPPPPPNWPLLSVPAGKTLNTQVNADGTQTIQFAVDLDISVGFDVGVDLSISLPLYFGITGTQSNFAGTQCTIGSTASTSTQWFEAFAQGGAGPGDGLEYHIWQCAPGPGGDQPQTCVPESS